MSESSPILVTGAAGFVGMHVAQALLARGEQVIGVDNLNDYYPPELKQARLKRFEEQADFHFERGDLADNDFVQRVFARYQPRRVIHLAAQAGVRYSISNPSVYVQSNLVAFGNMLEACRTHAVEHLVYASSSSVYGANTKQPFSTRDHVDHPISLYAASKKANELMAHTYSHLFGLPTTGLRFFTVYGPWGRPDMAYFKFTKAVLAGEPIDVYNHGKMRRDFTYIDDIVDGVVRVLDRVPQRNPAWSGEVPDAASSMGPYRVYNIGNNHPEQLEDLIRAIEQATGREAVKNYLPMQPGDVLATYADIDELRRDVGFEPKTPIAIGIPLFVEWFRAYYGRQ
ncbi:MAG: NAD-dependent epimerase [Proteobacteria bacterium]|nr:NAD-dependent epimerase [Pseudomonadota bacterium]